MKSLYKYYLALCLLVGFAPIDGNVEQLNNNYNSKQELEAAFIKAIKNGNSGEVENLIRAGANPNQVLTYIQDDYDSYHDVTCSALEYAAGHGHVDIIKVLIKADPCIDDVNNALIFAAEYGHEDVVEELLEVPGININYDNQRETALTIAIRNGHPSVVKALIRAGVNLNYIDGSGDSPLTIAVYYSRPLSQFSSQAHERSSSRWERRAEIINILLKKKVNINHADKSGHTALMLAIKNHDIDTVQNILQIPGLNLNHANRDGNTAFMIAIQSTKLSYVSGDWHSYHACINSQMILEALCQSSEIDLFHINKRGEIAIDLLTKLVDEMEKIL